MFGVLSSNKNSSQTRLSIKAADSLDFIFTFNQVAVNQLPVLSITLDKLPAGKHNIKVAVPSHPEIVINSTYPQKKHLGLLRHRKIQRRVQTGIEVGIDIDVCRKHTFQSAVDRTKNLMNIPTPIEAVDSSSSVQNNNSSCQSPVHPEDFEQMIAEVNAHFFETKKLDVMKTF